MKQTKQAAEDSIALFTYFNEIAIISQLAGTMFERNLPEGLTSSQFAVLNWFFRVGDEASPSRLATAFQVTPGAMTNTLKKLESKGLVKVEPDSSSGRQKRVTITAQGRRMRDKGIASAAPMLAEFAASFPADIINRQTKELQKVRQYLDEYRYR